MSNAARFARAWVVRIYDHGETTTVLTRDGTGHRLSGASADLARTVLAYCVAPRSREDIHAHVTALSGAPIEHPEVLDELIDLLERLGVLARETESAPARAGKESPAARIVLALCGAVAAMYAPSLVSLLMRHGFRVRVVATEAALKFVRAEGIEALTHEQVGVGLWHGEEAAQRVPHIELAQWADIVLICPATATTIHRIATGDCSELVSAIAITTRAPVVVVPSMNAGMFTAPSVRRNLETLVSDGFYVAHPAIGHEVAQAPDARTPMLGPAPSHDVVLQVVQAVLAERGAAP